MVIEEGDPVLVDAIRAAGIQVEGQAGDVPLRRAERGPRAAHPGQRCSPEPAPPAASRPQLCDGCPYRHGLRGAEASSTASWPATSAATPWACCRRSGDGHLRLHGRQPRRRAWGCATCCRRSRRAAWSAIIGDSTFMHTGVTGLMEMVYNPPATGHVVIVLDNGTTAMTGQQEHPATGRNLDHARHRQGLHRGARPVHGREERYVVDAFADPPGFERLLVERLATAELSLIVSRRPCMLAAADIRKWISKRRATGRAAARARPRWSHERRSTNVVLAGLGGQGVIKASDILADAAVRAGCDVKKAEVHGMSQRGGSVTCDVRFGEKVLSPMIAARRSRLPAGAGALQVEVTRPLLRPGGVLIRPDLVDESAAAQPQEPQRRAARRAERPPRPSRRRCSSRGQGGAPGAAPRRERAGLRAGPLQRLRRSPSPSTRARALTPEVMSTAWNDPAGGFHPQRPGLTCRAPDSREVQLQRLQSVVARAYEQRGASSGGAWRSGAHARLGARARGSRPGCRSPSRPISATPTRSACSPARWRRSSGCTPPRHHRQAHRGRLHPGRPRGLDQVMVRGLRRVRPAPRRRDPERLRLRPVHRRARARTTAPKRSGRPSSPSPAATPSGRSW